MLPSLTEILSRTAQLLPLLQARAAELQRQGYHLTDHLLSTTSAGNVRGTEALLAEARALYQAVQEESARLRAHGAELKGPDLVDLWSLLDAKTEVLLCFKLGEREIAWFHPADAGFAARQSVAGRRFTASRED